ncbi:tetratricopeptide repeat-containing glycosyltransferase family protein [Paludibacterium sp.]|uniref:tetratricopeptide repeat-containing glycosyltransferase family protein n=1 Tax=Paludibacterium sp. TaxID=1917523 RepID=UPI0025EF9B5D|nr:tetratricopeptide repeat-containing glycosyltransferase family protein [Paludibacterium sp.]MBV8645986.1 glycosyltransferase family protein [Paludibacterium sp.]
MTDIAVDEVYEQGCRHMAAGQLDAALTAFDAAVAARPDDWQALANRAVCHHRLEHYDLALDDYCEALKLQPDAPGLLINLAALLKELGQLDPAEGLLARAIELDPNHADAWSNLGLVRQHQRRYDDAAACHLRAIERAGASPARWTNLGNALTGGLHLSEAVDAYRQALALDADFSDARYNQAIPLLTLGRYLEAWPLYEARWQVFLTPRFQGQRWQGEALGRRTLLLWSEQGLGDSLQMARFIPQVRAAHPEARLLLSCPQSLHRLFSGLGDVELVTPEAAPAFDCQLPLASLPGVLAARIDTLPLAPYLSARANDMAAWAARLPPKQPGRLRVGLAWQSGVWGVGARDLMRQQKSIDPEAFSPLLPLADFVCLQPEPLPDCLQERVFAPVIHDFADTAAIIAHLDLVLCVDTAVAHLAGAMGKPVWVLMRHEGAPFFGAEGESAPWYPSARVLRQPAPGDWNAVLLRVAGELAALRAEAS